MGLKTVIRGLSPAEEAFLQALLWEEGHLARGPATQAAKRRGLSLLRCLEAANRLSSNLHGAALNRIRENPCPAAEWLWQDRAGDEVLELLWSRLNDSAASTDVAGRASR